MVGGTVDTTAQVGTGTVGNTVGTVTGRVGSGVDALAGRSMGFRLMQLSRRARLPVLAVKANTLGELRREMRGPVPALVISAGQCLSARQAVGGKR